MCTLSVRVRRIDARRREDSVPRPIEQDVGRLGAVKMTTLDQDRPRPKPMQHLGQGLHAGLVLGHRAFCEPGCLRKVRRDQGRAGQQVPTNGCDHVWRPETIAARRHKYRIEDDGHVGPRRKPVRDDLRDLTRRQHADLDRRHANVVENGVDLAGQELGRRDVNRGDAPRVLRGQRGQDGHAVAAERRERLEIGLDAGTAAGIRSGDGQEVRDRGAGWCGIHLHVDPIIWIAGPRHVFTKTPAVIERLRARLRPSCPLAKDRRAPPRTSASTFAGKLS